jgi:nucleolar GTP-binding protein
MIVMTKTDLLDPNVFSPQHKQMIEEISKGDNVVLLPMSTHSEEGIAEVKKTACEALLAQRVQVRMKGSKMSEISNRMHLAEPVARDNTERPHQIPETVSMEQKSVAEERYKDWEQQTDLYYEMDPDYTGVDQRKRYLMDDPEWRFDKIPEFMDGKNIADFWSNDLDEKLAQIEREELIRLRRMEQEASVLVEGQFELTPEQLEKVRRIRQKRAMIVLKSRYQKANGSTPLPRGTAARTRDVGDLADHLTSIGLNGEVVADALRSRSKSRSRTKTPERSESRTGRKRPRSEFERSQSMTPDRSGSLSSGREILKAQKLMHGSTRMLNRDGRKGTADRHVFDEKPKHLYSGKAGFSRDRR